MAHILVIDDDPQMRDLLSRSLKARGYEVSTASDGEEGLRLYEQQIPDLIITDIIMPNKEGLETIMEIHLNHPEVKIIAISGGGRVGTGGYLDLAKKMGAKYVFEKPLDFGQFFSAIKISLPAA